MSYIDRKDLLSATIAVYSEQGARIAQEVKRYIQDTSINLTARWEVFEQAHKAKLLPEASYVQHIDAFDAADISWYDDFYKERYVLVEWLDIVEQIEGAEGDHQQKLVALKEKLDEIKEQILAAGYGSFTYDW